jgi:hypothetical protein
VKQPAVSEIDDPPPDFDEKSERFSTDSALNQETIMPFARIDLAKGKTSEYRAAVADVVSMS